MTEARLTRIRLEAVAPSEAELRDYLVEQMEEASQRYGFVWELREPIAVQTTKAGFWGRLTLWRSGVPDAEVTRTMR